MSTKAFFGEDARRRAAETVAAIERETSAEVVVCVRRRSERYRDLDLAAGFVVSLLVLLLLLFLDTPFPLAHFPLDVTLAFVAGAWFSSTLDWPKRFLVRPRRQIEAVGCVARSAFVDLGISRTRDRTGILVLLSLLERRVEILPDIGVDPSELGPAWDAALAAVAKAAGRADFDGVLAALLQLREPLARALPRGEDDVNELPDAMDVLA